MKKSLLFLLLALLPALAAAQDDDVSQLLQALADIEHVQGEFRQRQFDASGDLLAESSGRFKLRQPAGHR
jgi:outer membrane lipoprotein-sorting protein